MLYIIAFFIGCAAIELIAKVLILLGASKRTNELVGSIETLLFFVIIGMWLLSGCTPKPEAAAPTACNQVSHV